jgi:hypothetical protein
VTNASVFHGLTAPAHLPAAAVQRQPAGAAGVSRDLPALNSSSGPENLVNLTDVTNASLPVIGASGGEPDIQELASLVYVQLRRRLAVERERLGY